MWLTTQCDLEFELARPTPFILMLRARSGPEQWVARETFLLEPMPPTTEYIDPYGNLGQRLVAEPGRFRVQSAADVLTRGEARRSPGARFVPVAELPDAVLPFLLPSRYCESEQFQQLAWEVVTDARPGYDQVERISWWIRERFRFNPRSPYFQQSAVELNRTGEGVCRELAHLGIALCRALSIPARLAVGYLHELEPMDLHAWFEAFVGDAWYPFDPTQGEWRGGRVVIGCGRDAADVAVFNQFGPMAPLTRMQVRVRELTEAPRAADPAPR